MMEDDHVRLVKGVGAVVWHGMVVKGVGAVVWHGMVVAWHGRHGMEWYGMVAWYDAIQKLKE